MPRESWDMARIAGLERIERDEGERRVRSAPMIRGDFTRALG